MLCLWGTPEWKNRLHLKVELDNGVSMLSVRMSRMSGFSGHPSPNQTTFPRAGVCHTLVYVVVGISKSIGGPQHCLIVIALLPPFLLAVIVS
jgi:hypothetical protein